MKSIEIIAVVFSLLCVLLSKQRSVLNWPLGLVGVGAYGVVFYQNSLYADVLLQVFFLIQGVYGWYKWHNDKRNDHDILVLTLTTTWRVLYILQILVLALIWGFCLQRYTDDPLPYYDALAAAFSLYANFLMSRRYIEHWILWISADLMYIGIFWQRDLFTSSALYVLFLILCISGFISWQKQRNTNVVLP